MKQLTRISTRLILGALLCLGILGTLPSAEAYYWICSARAEVIWCPDIAFSNGVRYCNSGFYCQHPDVGLCHFTRC